MVLVVVGSNPTVHILQKSNVGFWEHSIFFVFGFRKFGNFSFKGLIMKHFMILFFASVLGLVSSVFAEIETVTGKGYDKVRTER